MKNLITERDIINAWRKRQSELQVPANAIVTPAAASFAKEHGIEIVRETLTQQDAGTSSPKSSTEISKTIVIGADHGGFDLKEDLKNHLSQNNFIIDDVGTFSNESVDYPDFAHAVAEKVVQVIGLRGIIVDGAGVGSAITANKVPGIRAATCHDVYTARNSRVHNDANILTLGSRVLGIDVAKLIVDVWLQSEFAGGRHQKRVDKIIAIEKKYHRG